jgi:hypothetical protein
VDFHDEIDASALHVDLDVDLMASMAPSIGLWELSRHDRILRALPHEIE